LSVKSAGVDLSSGNRLRDFSWLSAFAEYHKHVEDPAVVKAGPVGIHLLAIVGSIGLKQLAKIIKQ